MRLVGVCVGGPILNSRLRAEEHCIVGSQCLNNVCQYFTFTSWEAVEGVGALERVTLDHAFVQVVDVGFMQISPYRRRTSAGSLPGEPKLIIDAAATRPQPASRSDVAALPVYAVIRIAGIPQHDGPSPLS